MAPNRFVGGYFKGTEFKERDSQLLPIITVYIVFFAQLSAAN